ncbi:MAG: hypothetical protein ACMUIE_05640 [Thermoplasmatota archaeon]
MSRRSPFAISVLLAVLLALPMTIINADDGSGASEPPSRYGYTPSFYEVATPSSEALSVATGNIDGVNNDDLVVGINGAVIVYTNNGGSGGSFGFSPYRTISLTGWYITDLKVVDYDNDPSHDLDIIALGQDEYGMAGENGGIADTIGSMRVFYLENTGSGFTLETYHEFTDVFYSMQGISFTGAWFWGDGKYDMDNADVDGDGDIDTAVIYNRDTNGNAGNQGEDIVLALLRYSSSGLARSNVTSKSYPASWNMNCFVGFADFNKDSNMDIAFAWGGVSNNNWVQAEVRAIYHQGVTVSWGNEKDLDPNHVMRGDGTFPTVPYAMAVGNFAGDTDSPIDVAITIDDNQNVNPVYTDGQAYIIPKLPYIPSTPETEFKFADPQAAYSQDYKFQFRGFGVGNLDNKGNQDVIMFSKQDDGSDDDFYNNPTDYNIFVAGGRTQSPVRFDGLKVFSTISGSLPSTAVVKAVGIGEFDGNKTYADIVYVGNKVTVGLTSFPDNNVPTKVTVNMDPSPVLNNGDTAVINVTVQDLDGWNDLRSFTADFRSIGLRFVSMGMPTGHSDDDRTIGYYEFRMDVPETVPQGDYIIPMDFYDAFGNPTEVKSNDTFLFRVKQFNREPTIVLDEGNWTLNVPEDQVTYFEGVYNWFEDLDIEQGYTNVPLNISLKTKANLWDTFIEYEGSWRAELVNGSGENPWTWALRITPNENFNHELDSFAADTIRLRARDGSQEVSEELKLKINVFPVNDLPTIPPQGTPKKNFEWLIFQDDFTQKFPLTARDAADGDPDGLKLNFSFVYDDITDEEWLTCTEKGIVSWNPRNEHVGSHRVTLQVEDGFDVVEKVLWFNVTNLVDTPYFISVANATKEIPLPSEIHGRYLFTVYEHEEFNLTIKAGDVDIDIGEQDLIIFQCNLTLSENTYLDVDEEDPTTAYLHFYAEKKFGYAPTYEPDYPPIDTEIFLVDEVDPEKVSILPIRIVIVNVNDPPVYVGIDTPEEGQVFEILYKIPYSAEVALDPDTDLNDTLRYVWDFDASDGFQEDANEISGTWDFPMAGTYTITLRVYDSADNYIETVVNITVKGIRDDNDYDNDGMSNEWEEEHGFNPYDPSDANIDTDDDGWFNWQEALNGTDPRVRDTDKDGVIDGEDFDPLDPSVTAPPSDKGTWVEDNFTSFLIIIILIAVLLLVLIVGVVVILIRANRKKAEEEEERRKQAEEMQKSLYEGQDIYADLPQMEQPGMMPEAPAASQLPPPTETGDLDDIFGGAGLLPTTADQGALPPGPQETPSQPPQAALPEAPREAQQGPAKSDDLTQLLE